LVREDCKQLAEVTIQEEEKKIHAKITKKNMIDEKQNITIRLFEKMTKVQIKY
jgi:hypothetical protein